MPIIDTTNNTTRAGNGARSHQLSNIRIPTILPVQRGLSPDCKDRQSACRNLRSDAHNWYLFRYWTMRFGHVPDTDARYPDGIKNREFLGCRPARSKFTLDQRWSSPRTASDTSTMKTSATALEAKPPQTRPTPT